MSMGDLIGYEDSADSCIVCGKGLRPGEALAKMHQGESKLPICCPLCLEALRRGAGHARHVTAGDCPKCGMKLVEKR
jgi:predicted RNA-binding Zn-ribbon protein involved in translation (DUF1610 family)